MSASECKVTNVNNLYIIDKNIFLMLGKYLTP